MRAALELKLDFKAVRLRVRGLLCVNDNCDSGSVGPCDPLLGPQPPPSLVVVPLFPPSPF